MKYKFHDLWVDFKWLTVAVSFLLSLILFVISFSLLFNDFFAWAGISAFFGLAFYSFSRVLATDIKNEDGPDDPDDSDMTTIYRFV